MPKRLHRALEKQARAQGITGKRKDAYVYGTLKKVEKSTKQKRK